MEAARQFALRALSVISGCNCVGYKKRKTGSPIRVKITFGQLLRAIVLMVLPSLVLQILILSHPSLRSTLTLISIDVNGVALGRYECKSMAVGSWEVYVSILFAIAPLALSYLLNNRPKSELKQLPDIIDERESLKKAFVLFVIAAVIAGPSIRMSIAPTVQAYAAITITLALPLSLCHFIALKKLGSISSNLKTQKRKGPISATSKHAETQDNAAFAVKMCEMYESIGRIDETIQLVDETLNTWRKGTGINLGQKERKEEVASGFTKNDLKSLDPDELSLVIHLLRTKARAIMKLDGDQKRSASINIDALRIFESCPAAHMLKDIR